ncbi:hypothetical protein SDC9_173119 [bioreactor metagenome]|uniref:Uncharacterized protein n=1 Tax=bioreactor metagenome TaxID=1076179 RepID=A0A645GGA2_9ZZZZ
MGSCQFVQCLGIHQQDIRITDSRVYLRIYSSVLITFLRIDVFHHSDAGRYPAVVGTHNFSSVIFTIIVKCLEITVSGIFRTYIGPMSTTKSHRRIETGLPVGIFQPHIFSQVGILSITLCKTFRTDIPVEWLAVIHRISITLLTGDTMAIPSSTPAYRHLVTGHRLYTIFVIQLVITAREDQFRVFRNVKVAIKQGTVRVQRIDILPSAFLPALLRIHRMIGRFNGLGIGSPESSI